jgi:N-acetylglucosamine-6-phosphate deacetylase
MPKCQHCAGGYDVGDLVCPTCDRVLPDPTETWRGEVPEGLGEAHEEASGADEAQTAMTPAAALEAVLERIPPHMVTILSGGDVFTGAEELDPGTVFLGAGRVIAVVEGAMDDPENGCHFLDVSGLIVTPGFIDLHCHGMLGIDVNSAGADALHALAAQAPQFGVTALSPTASACDERDLNLVLEAYRAAVEVDYPGARLLGLHLESGFINPSFAGAQPSTALLTLDSPAAASLKKLIDARKADVLRVTLAPELPGAEALIRWLRERRILVSLGHSGASYAQASAAIDAGATTATHLFNAMAPLHHREPGLVGAVLECDDVFVELVCDGVHVHPAIISMVISAKGGERVLPVTDSLSAAGMGDGRYTLAGQTVIVRDGVARLADGTLAGGTSTMDAVLRMLVDVVGWDLGEAIGMVSATPALAMGRPDIGRLVPGAAADVVILDQDLQVVSTFVAGVTVWPVE